MRGLGSWGARCSSHHVALYGWAVWMEWSTGVVCARGEGNIGHARCGRRGGVETGPRPTAHLQESVGHLQAFPISRCKADWIHQFLSPPRHPLLSFSAPHQPLLPDGQDMSRSNTKYGTELDGTTLPTLLRTLLLTHSAIPGRHPMAGAKVCSPPREQPQAGSRGIPSRPVESFTKRTITTGPTLAPARLCLSRRIRLTLGRELGTEIPNGHQVHQ